MGARSAGERASSRRLGERAQGTGRAAGAGRRRHGMAHGARTAGRSRCGRAGCWAWPGRWMGVLAGSTGPSWCTAHLAQF